MLICIYFILNCCSWWTDILNLIFWSGIDYLHTDEKIILYFHKVKTHEIYITITRILNMIFVSIVFTFPIRCLDNNLEGLPEFKPAPWLTNYDTLVILWRSNFICNYPISIVKYFFLKTSFKLSFHCQFQIVYSFCNYTIKIIFPFSKAGKS